MQKSEACERAGRAGRGLALWVLPSAGHHAEGRRCGGRGAGRRVTGSFRAVPRLCAEDRADRTVPRFSMF